MTDDERETFDTITTRLKWDAVWWVTIMLIEKLSAPGCQHDSGWDAQLATRDQQHDDGYDGVW